MAKNLDINTLRSLIAISEESGFSLAASRVYRTQSALSQQMHKLERTVGQKLFEKQGRRRVLTSAGHNLLHYAQEIVALNDQALATVHASEQAGAIRLGAPHDIADSILPKYLSQFAKLYPNINVNLTVGRSPELMPLLEDGRLDMTLTTRHSDRLQGQLIRSSPTVWIASASFHHERYKPFPLVLADEPSIFRRMALDALEQRGVLYIERYTCSRLSSIKVAIVAGLGVTARTTEMMTPDLRILGEKDGLPPLPDINFYVYRTASELSRPAIMLFNLIRGQ